MAEVDAVVREVADAIRADLDRLTAEMTTMFIEVIPEFRHDDDIRRLMIASTTSNLTAIIDILSLGIGFDSITVPVAAAEYARRFAQHDLSLEALLRAYRLGEHMFLQRAITELGRRAPSADVALATTGRIAQLINSYIDLVIEGLIDIYSAERRRWDARSDAARVARVRAVLETAELDLAAAEEMLATPLRGWHQIVMAWTATEIRDSERLLRVATTLLTAATGKQPLVVPVDDHTSWLWISSAGRPAFEVDRLTADLGAHPGLQLAVGAPATGLTGFRRTYQDALRARAVALVGRQPLTTYSEVSLAGLLVDRLDDVRDWVAVILGDLTRPDEQTARLRDTVRAFLDTNGSYAEAAARLHVHKNTVHYRVRKAEELLGHPLVQDRMNIEVALLVRAQLGFDGTTGEPRSAR